MIVIASIRISKIMPYNSKLSIELMFFARKGCGDSEKLEMLLSNPPIRLSFCYIDSKAERDNELINKLLEDIYSSIDDGSIKMKRANFKLILMML